MMNMKVNDFEAFSVSGGGTGKTQSIAGSGRSFRSLLEGALTSETLASPVQMPAPKAGAIDNGVNAALILGKQSAQPKPSMVKVASASSFDEAYAMRENFNSGVNVEGYLWGLDSSGGPISATIAPSHFALVPEQPGAELSWQYNDDRAMTTLEGQESTPENPVMYVVSKDKENGGFSWHKVWIDQVDPCNATREEMFALLIYSNKEDPDAFYEAFHSFNTIDECGVQCGLFAEDQAQRNYLAVLRRRATELGEQIEANEDVGTLGKKNYDALLKIIDRMIEHAKRTKELLKEDMPLDKSKELKEERSTAQIA